MRKELEHHINQVWYGKEAPPAWLRALVPVYRQAFRLHRRWGRQSQPEDLKGRAIIVVGNLTAGGSGKTPLVIRLCKLLQESGLCPGVVSRGYGRSSSGMVRITSTSSPSESGDEPLLIAQRTGSDVVVCKNRTEGVRELFRLGANVVIADDGLQHHQLPRALEICVIDGSREFGNGLLMPAGPLREPASRLGSVDFVVVNANEDSPVADANYVPMHLAPGWLRELQGGGQSWRLSQFTGCQVNAVAGIANPDRFFSSLNHAGLKSIEHAFPDHHPFTVADFAAMEPGLPIIMTEKDAVKCRDMNLRNAWYLSVDAVLPPAFEAEVVRRTLTLSAPTSPS